MKYPKNRFYANFAGVFKSKDNEITADLLNHEIAYLIIHNKKDLRKGFEDIGIKFPKNATEKDYVDKIVDNGDNRRVCVMLAYYITEKNKKELEKHSNVSSLSDAENIENEGSADNAIETSTSGGTVGAIAGALGSVFGFLKSSNEAKSQKESNRAALIQALLAAKTAKSGSGKSNAIWWILGGLVLVGGIVGMYFYFKSQKAKETAPALGSGGEVPIPAQQQVQQPAQQQVQQPAQPQAQTVNVE